MQFFNTLKHWDNVTQFFCLHWMAWLVNLHADWPWVVIGLLPVLLLVPSLRLAIVCPEQRAWPLIPWRWLGRLIVLAVVLSLAAALFIGSWAYTHSLPVYQQLYPQQLYPDRAEQEVAKLWGYVWGQLDLIGYGALAGAVLGFIAWLAILWFLEPFLTRMLRQFTKKGTQGSITSASKIADHLPEAREFDPRRYFEQARKQNTVFFGIDENNKPLCIPREVWKQSNVQIMGVDFHHILTRYFH